MTIETLLACLQDIQPPADIEEWIRTPAAGVPARALSTDYRQGVRDVLAAFGVLSENGEPASPMAYYFIQSLLRTIQDGALDAASWQDGLTEPCSGIGSRLVHLLEQHRLECAPVAEPLRVVEAVTAVIKARRAGGDVYLMQYDEKARQFQPLGGKREAFDANSEAALARELCEELSIATLTPGTDFRAHPIVEHVQMKEVSASLHVVTAYDHSLYHLTDVRFPLHTDHVTRWITAAELAARKTTDGLAITSLMDDHAPGILPTLGYSLPEPLP
jgi:8-oxo-dGTP pyrophosphatase MutT (NUDIX family)